MSLYNENIEATSMSGERINMSSYSGKVLLIVNTASNCGFTPQFEGLEQLYQKFKNSNFEVLGFPCNQFKNQDSGSNVDIDEFCKLNYGVSFQMFQKIKVNGDNRHILYRYLIMNSKNKEGQDIKWNFEKFIINRKGKVVSRFSSLTKPKQLEKIIEKLL